MPGAETANAGYAFPGPWASRQRALTAHARLVTDRLSLPRSNRNHEPAVPPRRPWCRLKGRKLRHRRR